MIMFFASHVFKHDFFNMTTMKLFRLSLFISLHVFSFRTSAQNGTAIIDNTQLNNIQDDIWKHYSFRPSMSPTTYTLSEKNKFRFDLSPLFFLKRKVDTLYSIYSNDGRSYAKDFFENNSVVDGIGARINVSYTPFERITFGTAFSYKYMINDVGHLITTQHSDVSLLASEVNNLYRHQVYSSKFLLGELSGTFHDIINSFCAFEIRSSIALSRSKLNFFESHGMRDVQSGRSAYSYKDDGLQYYIFNHSFEFGFSVFPAKRWVQFTALLAVGYTTYFRKKTVGEFHSKQVYEQVVIPFNLHPYDMFWSPSVMLSFNLPNLISLRLHCGFEGSVQHFRYNNEGFRPIFGLMLSFSR